MAMLETANCGLGRYEADITLEELRDYLTEGLSDLKPFAYTDVAAWIRSTTLDRAQTKELRWFLKNLAVKGGHGVIKIATSRFPQELVGVEEERTLKYLYNCSEEIPPNENTDACDLHTPKERKRKGWSPLLLSIPPIRKGLPLLPLRNIVNSPFPLLTRNVAVLLFRRVQTHSKASYSISVLLLAAPAHLLQEYLTSKEDPCKY